MSDTELYPLKFHPILKEKIWGGEKLGTELDKPIGENKKMGESWEISGVEGNISIVSEGPLAGRSLVELINSYKGDLVGEKVYQKFGDRFPLLIKFIDANDDLSIQVHPDDELAEKRHNSFGKTEMWYAVHAEEGATLISGFNRPTYKEEYLKIFEAGNLMDILNKEEVNNDDVFFLPAGRVHTIGKGLLIAEIQQTSDITYRIYDFDRVDENGEGRDLHIKEAIDAIDFDYYEEYKSVYDKNEQEVEIGRSEYFVTTRLRIDSEVKRTYRGIDSCFILMVLEGHGSIKYGDNNMIEYTLGDSILIPDSLEAIDIRPASESKILEVYIP